MYVYIARYLFVIILHYYSGADTKTSDNSDMNPFMLAVVKHRLEVVKAMMKEDPGLMSLSMGSGTTVIHWALEQSHHCCSAFFKVWFFILTISYTVLFNYFNNSTHCSKMVCKFSKKKHTIFDAILQHFVLKPKVVCLVSVLASVLYIYLAHVYIFMT